jgi:hypothetical protein
MDDPSMFVGEGPTPTENPRTFHTSSLTPLNKRKDRALYCLFCDRACPELFFERGCTYECAVSYLFYTEDHNNFDIVFTEVGKRKPYVDRGVYPKILPRKAPEQSDFEYWNVHGMHVYNKDDIRYRAFEAKFTLYFERQRHECEEDDDEEDLRSKYFCF